MFLYLMAGIVILYCIKRGYQFERPNHNQDEILKVLEEHSLLRDKLIEMDANSRISAEDFAEILPVCEFLDEWIEKIKKMPESESLGMNDLQKLAEIVRQRIG